MKSIILALALPLLLTGCAGTYVGAYGPNYPGYWDGYDYGGPGYIGFSSYDRGYYNHGYHHYDTAYNHGGSSASYHSSHVASAGSVNHFSDHASAGSHSASVSSGGGHSGGGGGGGFGGGRR